MRLKINMLIAAVASGDVNALDELARVLSARMLSVARSIVGNTTLAEDVVQDSFLKILSKADRFAPNSNGYAWICKIVHNTALGALKREKIRRGVDIDEFFDIGSDLELAESATAAATVRYAMSALDPLEKRVVYQKYFMDFTVRDSAKALGKSKSTIARTISKAEEKMRAALAASASPPHTGGVGQNQHIDGCNDDE